ncbi:flagellar hook protein FlgE [Bacillus pseudomycoides]|nr:flagellar hook protein FlgE [Bacillus pseudomycoides]
MIKALYTSITGMNATQNALSVTSNNIANAQTVGYKKQKAIFDDLLYNNTIGSRGSDSYAGTNPKSIGNGVKLSGTTTDYTTGSITMTGVKTQAAIDGNGFFMAGDINGGNVQYTRKGTFDVSRDYKVITGDGQYVLGYGVKPGTEQIDTSGSPQPISIPLGAAIAGVRTDKASVLGNIDRNLKDMVQDFNVYDDAGNKIIMRVQFNKSANPGEYEYSVLTKNVSKNEKEFTPVMDNGAPFKKSLTFDNKGNLTKTDVPVVRDNVTGEITQGGTVAVPFDGTSITLNIGGLTNYPTEKTLTAKDITGNAAAVANDYFIADGGYVMLKYSDGGMKVAGQLAVATFPNANGLMKTGNGNYIATSSAGEPSVGGANGSSTKVMGSSQEGSNVDLAVEFVDLMLYQKGFTGNAKVIKVADDVLNEVVNLIR